MSRIRKYDKYRKYRHRKKDPENFSQKRDIRIFIWGAYYLCFNLLFK